MVAWLADRIEREKQEAARREEAEAAVPAAMETPQTTDEEKSVLGLTLRSLDDATREELGLASNASGLAVLDVDETTEAFEKGLRAGDVITEAGQQKVATLGDLDARIADAKSAGRKSLLLLVRRGGDPRFVALSLEDG